MLRQAGRFTAVGLEIGFSMAIGLLGGTWLDQKLDTGPVFFWIGFALGVGAAGKAIVDVARIARKKLDSDGQTPPKKD